MSRVLLVRMDGFGDALALAPLLAALRDAGHTVGALLGATNSEAFASSALYAVHVVERIPWPRHGSTPQSYANALAQVREAGYDVALIASEEPQAFQFARDARIARRVGFANGWEKPFKSLWVRTQVTHSLYRPASAARERIHEVETLFALGAGLHSETVPTNDVRRLRPLIVDEPITPSGGVAIQVSAKFARAGLDAAAFARIVEAIGARTAAFALSSRADEAFARVVCASTGIPLEVDLDTKTWKSRLAAARAVVTPDSGAAHVAGMCGVPSVDLFAATPQFASDVVRWRPWAAPARTLPLAALDAGTLAEAVCAALETLPAPAAAP